MTTDTATQVPPVQQQKKQPKWAVDFPDKEHVGLYERPSLKRVCQGNERMASVLNFFLYEGSWEIERQHLPEGCKEATFTCTHDAILQRLTFDLAKRSLKSYLKAFNERGYVTFAKFQKVYTVHFDKIQEAINNPPALKERKKPTHKVGNEATLPTSEKEAKLPTNQATLPTNDAMLHTLVGKVAQLYTAFATLVEWIQGQFPEHSIPSSILSLFSIDTGDTALDAPMPARVSSLSQQIDKRLSDPRLTAITAEMLEDRDRQSRADGWQASPVADEEDELEKTVKRPAVRVAAPAPEQTVRGATEPIGTSGGAAALSPSAGTLSPCASVQSKPRAPGGKGKNGSVAHVAPPIPDAALAILDAWDSLFKAPVARTDKHIEAAIKLIACHPTRDDLQECKGWLFTTDNPERPWYRKKGVKLIDVAENYGAWQSVQDAPVQNSSKVASAPPANGLKDFTGAGKLLRELQQKGAKS